MKIAIFGTSNSIMTGGWVQGLRDGLVGAQITNFSVGDSPGVQFATLLELDLSNYDCIFFDSVINDSVMSHHGYIASYDIYRNLLAEIFSTIRKKTRLIQLIFPRAPDLVAVNKVLEDRKELSRLTGAIYVDILSLLQNSFDGNLTEDFLFQNPDHIKEACIRPWD